MTATFWLLIHLAFCAALGMFAAMAISSYRSAKRRVAMAQLRAEWGGLKWDGSQNGGEVRFMDRGQFVSVPVDHEAAKRLAESDELLKATEAYLKDEYAKFCDESVLYGEEEALVRWKTRVGMPT
jgi:hypothetical protein